MQAIGGLQHPVAQNSQTHDIRGDDITCGQDKVGLAQGAICIVRSPSKYDLTGVGHAQPLFFYVWEMQIR